MISHQLLYRAGFLREVAAGRYILTPLGLRAAQKIIQIIDEEMAKIGSLRVILPTLHPLEIWQKTHRDTAWGEGLMKIKDRRGMELALGATAEGLMVELVKMFRPTHKDLPIVLHQFSQKFRDELRARGGLIRLREFLMKDAYSFAADEKQFMQTYWDQYHAYEKIAQRLGLAVVAVEADSGALGGDFCHEFMVLNGQGEDRILVCEACDYKANVEKAEFVRELINPNEPLKPLATVSQPEWVESMKDNEKHYSLPAARFLKNVVYRTARGKAVIAVIRGDLEVNEAKLTRLVGEGELTAASDKDIEQLGTKPGWVHSWGHKGVLYVGDLSLKTVRNFIGGQKERVTDTINVNYGRDFKVEKLGDIALAPAGAVCGQCQKGKLQEKRAVEFGHCFKYDDFYTKAQDGFFTDKDGREKLLQMGAFGIGIERALALVVEAHHDEKGIVWPKAVSPFQIHLLDIAPSARPLGDLPGSLLSSAGNQGANLDGRLDGASVAEEAEKVYQQLAQAGVEVFYDDRADASAGVKFADADLLGLPLRLVISEKSLESGGVEVRKRSEEKTSIMPLGNLVPTLKKELSTSEVEKD